MSEQREESVDRIRDIIFGPKMRDYEQRFEALVSDVARLQTELNRLDAQLAAQTAAQSRSQQALRQDLHSEIVAESNRLAGQLAEQAATSAEGLQGLRSEMRQADGELRDELRRMVQKLTDEKTDRNTLGDLFVELGRHVKSGGALSDLLQGLEEAR